MKVLNSSKTYMKDFPVSGKTFILTGKNGTGKTRLLEAYTCEILKKNNIGNVICLSGTVLDRFPITTNNINSDNSYIYLGKKTNNNMFSEIAPYRRIFTYLLNRDTPKWESRALIASQLLSKIGLGNVIKFKFRAGRNKRINLDGANRDLKIHLDAQHEFNRPMEIERLTQVDGSELHISGVFIEKNGVIYDIADLSSGERCYALVIISMAFCTADRSVVLFDEPENSMHPKWQLSLISDMWEILNFIDVNAKIIIATHSPLVSTSSRNESTYLLSLDEDSDWTKSNLFGHTSDNILKIQFGLNSARSNSFIVKVNNCLSSLLRLGDAPDEFKRHADILLSEKINIGIDDVLFDTIEEIKKIRGELQ
ncbi:AAA family ATPase [Aeromonas caviae]|uniref:AAA family ATPase n=1 Tax=Aeromonas caviae TaxID=648 RepID=UPI0031FC248B